MNTHAREVRSAMMGRYRSEIIESICQVEIAFNNNKLYYIYIKKFSLTLALLKPFIGPSYWKRVEYVQNIRIRTITGMPTIVENSILLKSAYFESIQNSIRSQIKTMFYKTSFSDFNHIRVLGKTHKPPTTKKSLKPYQLT